MKKILPCWDIFFPTSVSWIILGELQMHALKWCIWVPNLKTHLDKKLILWWKLWKVQKIPRCEFARLLIKKLINVLMYMYWLRKTLRNLDQEMRKTLILASALSKNQPLSNTASGRINMRRRTVINEQFARNIAEQMSKSELHGFDIQLTRVRQNY